MPDRRPLSFDRLEDVPAEVDRLLTGGHRTVGRWTLAQICTHLAAAIRVTVKDGGASVPEPLSPAVERNRKETSPTLPSTKKRVRCTLKPLRSESTPGSLFRWLYM